MVSNKCIDGNSFEFEFPWFVSWNIVKRYEATQYCDNGVYYYSYFLQFFFCFLDYWIFKEKFTLRWTPFRTLPWTTSTFITLIVTNWWTTYRKRTRMISIMLNKQRMSTNICFFIIPLNIFNGDSWKWNPRIMILPWSWIKCKFLTQSIYN